MSTFSLAFCLPVLQSIRRVSYDDGRSTGNVNFMETLGLMEDLDVELNYTGMFVRVHKVIKAEIGVVFDDDSSGKNKKNASI